MSDRKRTIGVYAGVFVVYALLTLVMTWPVVARLNTHLIGTGDDMWVHYWNDWWVKRVLQQGGSVYYTPLLFHPTGVSLVHHNFAWTNIALWLVLEPLIGGIAAYNLTHLIHIPLCGLGMFMLARRLTKSNAVAFVSGLVYAFWPYRMLDTDHPNMIATEGLPLLMLVLLDLVEGNRPLRDGIIAGLVVALIGYTRWQLLVLAGFMTVLYLLYTLIWERGRWNRRTVIGLTLVVVIAGALMAPGLYPLVREQMRSGLVEEVYAVRSAIGKHDLLSYVVPQYQHLLGPLHDRLLTSFAASQNRKIYTAFLGYVAVGLSIVGLAKYRGKNQTWFWLGMAILILTLAPGPELLINRQLYPQVPMPYRLVAWLPPIQMLGPAQRFNALLALPIAVLSGFGALALREWLAKRRLGKWIARPAVFVTLLGGLILLDYLSIPTATVSAHIPAFYYSLAKEPGDFAIVGMPGKRHFTENYMFYQTVHERPLLGGHVSRLPPEALDFASSVPLIADMYVDLAIDTSLPDVSHQLSMLADVGFRYIIIHKEFTNEQQMGAWRDWLVVRPRYEDEEVVVYSTAPVVGEDVSLRYDLGAGVGLIGVNQSTGSVSPDASLEFQVIWGTTAPPGADLDLELALVNEEGDVEQAEQFEIVPSWPTGEWPANAIARDVYTFTVEPWVSGGKQAVVAGLVRVEDGQPVGRQVKIGQVVMQAPERSFAVPPMEQKVGADFGADLRLLGYDFELATDEARVTLHWQALRRMDNVYKFFVHLYDPESNELVAQMDVMARNWSYLTTWWEVEEIESVEVQLPLGEVSPGEYWLGVGAYNAANGERLSVSNAGSLAAFSDVLMLRKVDVP